jgi:hypothetical protein
VFAALSHGPYPTHHARFPDIDAPFTGEIDDIYNIQPTTTVFGDYTLSAGECELWNQLLFGCSVLCLAQTLPRPMYSVLLISRL